MTSPTLTIPHEVRIPTDVVLAAMLRLQQLPIQDMVAMFAPEHADGAPVAVRLLEQMTEELGTHRSACITLTIGDQVARIVIDDRAPTDG